MVQLAIVKTLFVWCAIRALDGYRAFVTSLLVWCISSVPRVFNHTSAHDKSSCNSACARQFLEVLHALNVQTHACRYTRV